MSVEQLTTIQYITEQVVPVAASAVSYRGAYVLCVCQRARERQLSSLVFDIAYWDYDLRKSRQQGMLD